MFRDRADYNGAMNDSTRRVAIIGAGISGMTCAARLQSAGFEVSVFEKSRGAGGRITTRRRDRERFDHGAQFFTARTPQFLAMVTEWAAQGIVAPWLGRFGDWRDQSFFEGVSRHERWVGTPRMSSLGRHLAKDLSVHLQTKVVEIVRRVDVWCLKVESGDSFTGFDVVLLCCPGPQAVALLPKESGLISVARRLEYSPCWVAMLSYSDPLSVPFDGLRLDHPVLSWAARDSSKPGRTPGERWVLHASPSWSAAHLEQSPDYVSQHLVGEWSMIVPGHPTDVSTHRWRYSLAMETEGALAHYDSVSGLGLCGDAFVGPRIEDAWRSGTALADRILS